MTEKNSYVKNKELRQLNATHNSQLIIFLQKTLWGQLAKLEWGLKIK